MANKMLSRMFQPASLRPADLDSTTFGKPGHLKAPTRTILGSPLSLSRLQPSDIRAAITRAWQREPNFSPLDKGQLLSRFLKENIIFLTGDEINQGTADQMMTQLLYLQGEDRKKDICMYINAAGGDPEAGMRIYDAMQWIENDVSTVNFGEAANIAALILAAGAKGKRAALPLSTVAIGGTTAAGRQGQASDLVNFAREVKKAKKTEAKLYAEMCGQTEEEMFKLLDRRSFFNATGALKFGFIDHIIQAEDAPVDS